jgi:serine/threonine protein phosphatase PrpC
VRRVDSFEKAIKARDFLMYESYSITDRGNVRPVNQDYSDSFCGRDYAFGVVCDGMGGVRGGNIASEFAGRWISEAVVTAMSENKDPQKIRAMFEDSLKKIPTRLYYLSKREGLDGMGTTAVICFCLDEKAYVYNVGDSRCYLVRMNEIRQISIDHSIVENMILNGEIDRESGRNHPQKNIITRALGPEETTSFDYFEFDVKDGDLILLCSDGLSNMLRDDEILSTIKENEENIIDSCISLSMKAKEQGGHDNISAVLIKYDKKGDE